MSELFTGVKRDFHDNGKLRSEVYMCNGKLEGDYKEYNDKGELVKWFIYVDGLFNGECKLHYINGEYRKTIYMRTDNQIPEHHNF